LPESFGDRLSVRLSRERLPWYNADGCGKV